MVGWHHRLNGHEFEQTLGDSEGQGSLVCCSPWSQGFSIKELKLFKILLKLTQEEIENLKASVYGIE